jgi:hypothetical protein
MITIKVKLEDNPNKTYDWTLDHTRRLTDSTKTFLKNNNISNNMLYHLYNPESNMFIINASDLKNMSNYY